MNEQDEVLQTETPKFTNPEELENMVEGYFKQVLDNKLKKSLDAPVFSSPEMRDFFIYLENTNPVSPNFVYFRGALSADEFNESLKNLESYKQMGAFKEKKIELDETLKNAAKNEAVSKVLKPLRERIISEIANYKYAQVKDDEKNKSDKIIEIVDVVVPDNFVKLYQLNPGLYKNSIMLRLWNYQAKLISTEMNRRITSSGKADFVPKPMNEDEIVKVYGFKRGGISRFWKNVVLAGVTIALGTIGYFGLSYLFRPSITEEPSIVITSKQNHNPTSFVNAPSVTIKSVSDSSTKKEVKLEQRTQNKISLEDLRSDKYERDADEPKYNKIQEPEISAVVQDGKVMVSATSTTFAYEKTTFNLRINGEVVYSKKAAAGQTITFEKEYTAGDIVEITQHYRDGEIKESIAIQVAINEDAENYMNSAVPSGKTQAGKNTAFQQDTIDSLVNMYNKGDKTLNKTLSDSGMQEKEFYSYLNAQRVKGQTIMYSNKLLGSSDDNLKRLVTEIYSFAENKKDTLELIEQKLNLKMSATSMYKIVKEFREEKGIAGTTRKNIFGEEKIVTNKLKIREYFKNSEYIAEYT
ncbi:MAG: hypothetical protein ACP5N3_03760 [Candidatus Nanoarchaeia archaeon]